MVDRMWQMGRRRWQRLGHRNQQLCQILLVVFLIGLLIRSLPNLAPVRASDLLQDQQAIEFTDRNGLPLGTLLTRDQDHTAVIPLAQVSPRFTQAILSAEDGRFYQHGPLEGRAIVRSTLEAIRAGRFRSGASTITMQLSQMINPVPSNLPGKIREIWLAWRLAAGMSKDEILHAYINRLPMGGNIYGVEAAARAYFGVSAADLNLAQASLLAALPNDPTFLNPYDYWNSLKERQAYVLRRMVQDGYISGEESDRALAEKVTFQPRQQGILAAPHFLFWVASQLPTDHPSQIRTTLDRPLQKFVETQVQQVLQTLTPHNVHHAAVLVIDNHTGAVLAYVGSPDYFAETQQGRNDGVQALRQPGSTLKPFLYELALETRVIRPNTVLADVPAYYAIPDARLYSPTDYSETFQGPVRVRIALANSLNIPAVRVLEQVGVQRFLDRLHQLDFAHLTQSAEHYGLGLSLGSGEVSLWELGRAYLTLAHQGQPTELKVLSSETPNLQSQPPTSPSWALIIDILSDRFARSKAFGVDSVLNLPFPAAVKTGTSSNFRDTWTVGFTTDYTVATWVGNFDGSSMRKVSGVVGAAPLWQRILLHLHENREPKAFPPPAGLVQRPICSLSGMRPNPACPAIVQEYFYPEDLTAYEQQPDPFYQQVSVEKNGEAPRYRLTLPPEYNEWLAKQPQSPLADDGSLRIVAPRNGDYFLVGDPTSGIQKLEFKLASSPEIPVEWWLNGQKLTSQTSSSFFWSLRPGNWRLEARSGNSRDQVQFEVQVADSSPGRRGFSVRQ
ncbi:MAG: penicillin-binding protein 1C [Leptolyngbyaceae cyanobacterium bins.59]|nr:penicillin-binding protein 1C [Leptolyngbyaceae cyanobacterium bins.59]